MRLWTLHPRYLDARGLVALWREALLAQKVLGGETRGYRHHPQLARFQHLADPVGAIASYLEAVLHEAQRRRYSFDAAKIASGRWKGRLDETRGQLRYEWEHLRKKLKLRDPLQYRLCRSIVRPRSHPLFHIVPGSVQWWEARPSSSSLRGSKSI